MKTTLLQRKVIERAKGLLMDMLHISEQEAFRRLQQQSQRDNRPMVDIAQAVITMHTLQQEEAATDAPREGA